MKRILSLTLVVLMMFSTIVSTSFATEADVKQSEQELESIKRQRQEKEESLSTKTEDRDAVNRSIEEVILEQQQVQARIEENTVNIEQKEEELEIIKAQLDEAQAEIKVQQDEFGDRLGVMYINQGTGSKLSALLKSKSISDFLIKLEYFKKIAEEDDRVLEALNVKREEIERLEAQEKENYDLLLELKEQLEADESRLVTLEAELEARRDELNAAIEEDKAAIAAYAADEERIGADIAAMVALIQQQREEAERQRREAEEAARREREAAARAAAEAAAEEDTYTEPESDYTDEYSSDDSYDDSVSRGEDSYVGAAGYVWPVPGYNYINSPFGGRWHPVLGTWSQHNGVDIPAPGGTPVVAARGGTVVMARYYSSFGNTVVIDHGDGMYTLYAHGSSYASYEGQWVEAGQVIMYVGTTGRSTGNHLHFSVMDGYWNFVNPQNYI